jgi:hypothetical protein
MPCLTTTSKRIPKRRARRERHARPRGRHHNLLSLSAVDGDTVRCDRQNMRIMGPGAPNKSGVDAPEIRNAKCAKERLLGEQAKLRLDELLRQSGTRIEDSGVRDRYGWQKATRCPGGQGRR